MFLYFAPQLELVSHQPGVRSQQRHSTETLNILTSDLALEAMDRKQVTALVLLDLSKAFDSIDHMSLLKKLRAMGTSKEAIEWCRSYLTGRKQSVRIGWETSEPRLVSYGVPQGSILGPALFNIYINDLPSVPKVGSLECYVDDSQLILSFSVNYCIVHQYGLIPPRKTLSYCKQCKTLQPG